jgi:tubulin polyglutamylase TTLL5
MGSRGAGLYGVFLKGIIDKISEAPVEPVPKQLHIQRNVYTIRYYKVVQNRTEVYDIVTRVFHQKEGWEELPHGLGLANAWNLCWTWSKPKLDYSRLCVWQKVNHFPDNKHLTRKDFLKRCIDRYTRMGGRAAQYFNICPKTFVLPKEYCLFIESFAKIAEDNGDFEESKPAEAQVQPPEKKVQVLNGSEKEGKPKVPNLWIMKPAGSSRGRGIQVVNDVGSVHYGELTIIQQYISNPYLLSGYKWDMRTYVTVTSFNPLEAFIYRDGFARFTTVPFSTRPEDIENKFVHLTNSSIQRHNEDSMMCNDQERTYAEEAQRQRDALLGGTKISYGTLRERLKANGVNWDLVWSRMIEVVLKSLCMAEDHIPNQVNSFELFGYDLLLDSDMRIWLIEVNASPSMGQEHLLDEQVKQPLIGDTIDLVEPIEFDRQRLSQVLHRRLEKKAATGSAGGRQQLDIDLHAILQGQTPRRYGELPKHMGNYERIAPSDMCDAIMRNRSQLFNK